MAARKKIVAIRTFQRYKAWGARKPNGRLAQYKQMALAMATREDAELWGDPVRVEVTVRVIEKKRGKR